MGQVNPPRISLGKDVEFGKIFRMNHTAKGILDVIDKYLEQEIRKDRPSPHDIDYFRLFAEASG